MLLSDGETHGNPGNSEGKTTFALHSSRNPVPRSLQSIPDIFVFSCFATVEWHRGEASIVVNANGANELDKFLVSQKRNGREIGSFYNSGRLQTWPWHCNTATNFVGMFIPHFV